MKRGSYGELCQCERVIMLILAFLSDEPKWHTCVIIMLLNQNHQWWMDYLGNREVLTNAEK